MSDDIQYEAFDGRPFGHRWSNRRVFDAPGAYGPPDDPREDAPEVWCSSCQWDHNPFSACIYGRNQR